jgi:hypothetical protein
MTKYIRIPGTFTGSDILIPADRIITIEDGIVNQTIVIKINGPTGFQAFTILFSEFNQDVGEYNMKSWFMKNVQRALVSNWQTNIFDATEPPCAITTVIAT